MEQRHRIRLTTSNTFDLEHAEIKRLYTYLGLFQYRYLRTPDYRERPLIEQLAKDFKSFHKEMLQQVERDPNNLVLNRINGFFSNHYANLKELAAEFSRWRNDKRDAKASRSR